VASWHGASSVHSASRTTDSQQIVIGYVAYNQYLAKTGQDRTQTDTNGHTNPIKCSTAPKAEKKEQRFGIVSVLAAVLVFPGTTMKFRPCLALLKPFVKNVSPSLPRSGGEGRGEEGPLLVYTNLLPYSMISTKQPRLKTSGTFAHRASILTAYIAAAFCLFVLPIMSAPADGAPTLSELQTNWPRFRGWDGSGVSSQTNAPDLWRAKDETGIVWHSAIPLPGHSSPVVWGDRVFISGGTVASREVFCYSAATGALLWRRALESASGSQPKDANIPEDTTYAASTMATDGHLVYAMFANGDLAALNFDGAIAWSKSFGILQNSYGFATSLAVWQNQLLLQLDQGDSEAAGSKLISLDGASGSPLWERPRQVPASWATPIIIEAAGKTQIITLAAPWVIAYSLPEGIEIWRAQLLEGEVVPSAVFAAGLVIVINAGDSKLLALRPDGAGDVTKTHIAWATRENVPDITSPAATEEFVFTVNSLGMTTCFDTKSGTKIWEKNLDMEVQASPALLGDRLIILGANGTLVILQAGREFHEIGRSQLPDKFTASPAFANRRMFLRGATNLYGLELLNPRVQGVYK
jgi:outer membrane protein assembly factor BamB